MNSSRNQLIRTRRSPLASVAAVIVLSLAAGCHKKQGPDPNSMGPAVAPPMPVPTATLSASPLAVDLGQSVVLNWRTDYANVVTIDGIGQVNASGTQTVSPSASTNFHLTAKGDGGTTEANVRVTVNVPVAPVAPSAESADMGSDSVFHQNVPDIFFDYDSYEVRADAVSTAGKAASYLTSHPEIRVVIGGYCDSRGSAEYNIALGENRANAAKAALVDAGISANRIRVVSYGKEKQFCSEETESCWQQNRRAQFSIDR